MIPCLVWLNLWFFSYASSVDLKEMISRLQNKHSSYSEDYFLGLLVGVTKLILLYFSLNLVITSSFFGAHVLWFLSVLCNREHLSSEIMLSIIDLSQIFAVK